MSSKATMFLRSRRFGMTTLQTEEFVQALKGGKLGLWYGPKVVAMPAWYYDQLMKRLSKVKKPLIIMDEPEENSHAS